jgi:hypothetical protein
MTTSTTQHPNTWLQDGNLIYRLEPSEYGPTNCDEIRVTQTNGSRKTADTSAAAAALLEALGDPTLAADGMLFRRCYAALVDPTNTSFADSMDRLVAARMSDDPPTIEELRALLTEALK